MLINDVPVCSDRCSGAAPTPGPVDNPQGAAFLAGFKYAKNKVFMYVKSCFASPGTPTCAQNTQTNVFLPPPCSQTPTFNAAPVIPAALDAVRRGVEVTLYLDIGFNDAVSCTPSWRIWIRLVC